MVTDWLHNPRALMLVPLLAATLCALVLCATRRRMPPEQPPWRLVRALIIVGFWIASVGVRYALLGKWAFLLLMPPMGLGAQAWLSLAAGLVGTAVFFGWLIPCGIEGRSLREMGWRRHQAVRYFLVAGIVTLIAASLNPMRGLPEEFRETLGIQDVRAGAILGMPIALMWVLVIGFVLSGWTEENFFRGHLLPAFREMGLSGRVANMAQAGVFMLVHIPGLMVSMSTTRPEFGPGPAMAAAAVQVLGWWLMGLLFGWLRMRFGSIVPSFAVHGTWNAVYFARMFAGIFVVMEWLS